MASGDFFDLLRQEIRPLGRHLRGDHFPVTIGHGHGQMGRVGDDHIGLGDLGHHPPAGHFPLEAAHPRLDQRVPFGLFKFFL